MPHKLTFGLAVFALFRFKVALKSGLLGNHDSEHGSVYAYLLCKFNATLNLNNAKRAEPNVNLYIYLKSEKNALLKYDIIYRMYH